MKLFRLHINCASIFLLTVFNSYAMADTTIATLPVEQDPIAVNNLIQLTLGMLVVLGVIMGLAWLAKRSGKFQLGIGGSLQVLGGLSVGGRERVVLLQIGEQQLLVGVTPGSVTTLHVLDKPIKEIDSDTKNTQGFSEQIAHFMSKGKSS